MHCCVYRFYKKNTYGISYTQHAIKDNMELERVIQFHLASVGERFDSMSRSG